MATYLGYVLLGYGGLGWSPAATGTATIEFTQDGTAIGGALITGLTEVEFNQDGAAFGAGVATGKTTIELESTASGFAGTVASGGTTIEFTTYGVTGINFTTEIEFEQSGRAIGGAVADGIATIEISQSGVCFGATVGTGQTDIEIETNGLGNYTVIGTGQTVLNIVTHGSAFQGFVASGRSSIEIDTAGSGFTGIVGTGTTSVRFTASGSGILTITGTGYLCMVINTKTGAVSEYDNYDFNSFCEFNGVSLGCRADGIYELDGADDDGTDIDAYVKWGFLDPNLPTASRLDSGFLVGEATGDIKVTTICDEDQSCEDILQHLNSRRDHPVKIARGFKGRLYEVKIENIDGAGFTLNSYRVLARELTKQR